MKAFLFDLNGTMIDDMKYHERAWYQAFTEGLQAAFSLEEMKAQMYGTNAEFIARMFGAGRFTDEQIEAVIAEKERNYQNSFRPYLRLIDGLDAFLQQAHRQGIRLGLGSAAPRINVDFAIDGLGIRLLFTGIVSGEDVARSKPDPEVFLRAAELCGVPPAACVVFEDNPKGAEAAWRAGMSSVVITTVHEQSDFEGVQGIRMFISDYSDPRLTTLLNAPVVA